MKTNKSGYPWRKSGLGKTRKNSKRIEEVE